MHNPFPIISIFAVCACLMTGLLLAEDAPSPDAEQIEPLFQTVDLDIGEEQTLELTDGTSVRVKLIAVHSERDTVRGAVRKSTVDLEIDGQVISIVSSLYNLPTECGDVQVDCPVTADYVANAGSNYWALDKDARIRIWPKDSPWVRPGTFTYLTPAHRWFASDTQMANDPCYVNACEKPSARSIYYHYGLDTGGAEGRLPVVAATDGIVASVGTECIPQYADDTPVSTRYDVVYVVDQRGWFYRYSHLHTIDESLQPGMSIRQGDPIGLLGKEGGSGGWTHIHFGIDRIQPSGRYGAVEGYAFLRQAYVESHPEETLQAVARPHVLIAPGEKAVLDATRTASHSPDAPGPLAYEWTFTNGETSNEPITRRTYETPGSYSEILKVTDADGNIDYDFAVVQVVPREETGHVIPAIHAVYYPTFDIRPGDAIEFGVRTFNGGVDEGEEVWNFGDGSSPATVKSDGCGSTLNPDGYAWTSHAYEQPGSYLVEVSRTNAHGETATGRLHVLVE